MFRYRVIRIQDQSSDDIFSSDLTTKFDKSKSKYTVESWNFEIRKVSFEDQGLYE
jgi:hypothetical protein